MKNFFKGFLLFTVLFTLIMGCTLESIDSKVTNTGAAEINDNGFNNDNVLTRATASTYLSASKEYNPSGNSNDRKIILTVFIKNNRYLMAKVQNFKRHWIGSSWNSHETGFHVEVKDFEVKDAAYGAQYNPLCSQTGSSWYSGRAATNEFIIGYIGRAEDAYKYKPFITKLHIRAKNDGMPMSTWAEISFTGTLPSISAYISVNAQKTMATASVSYGSGSYSYTWTVDGVAYPTSTSKTIDISNFTYGRYHGGGSYPIRLVVKDKTTGKSATTTRTVYCDNLGGGSGYYPY